MFFTEALSRRSNIVFSGSLAVSVFLALLGAVTSSLMLTIAGNVIISVSITVFMVLLCAVEAKRKKDEQLDM